MMKKTKNCLTRHYAARSLIALAVAGAFPLHAAMAQEAAPAEAVKAQPGQLETVIVTAQRRAENIKRALDGELYFYSRVFGFALADPVEPVVIENLEE